MAEHRTVDARVVGSTPISHPIKQDLNMMRSCFIDNLVLKLSPFYGEGEGVIAG